MTISKAEKIYSSLILVAFFLAILLLTFFTKNIDGTRSLEEAAILPGTTVIRGTFNQNLVHCNDSKDAPICLNNLKKNKQTNGTYLWLGNSQLHSINQIKPGDQPAPSILHKKALDKNKYVLTFSQANANLQEHLVILSYLSQNIKIDKLILPVFFDDLRETSVRNSVLDFFNENNIDKESSAFFRGLLNVRKSSGQFDEVNDEDNIVESPLLNLEVLDGTPQKKVENFLTTELAKISSVWNKQAEIRGQLLINLYKFRNYVFGITASSIRKSIPSRYKKNMKSLDEILILANKRGIEFLVYIPPLRDDFKRPYDDEEYSQFKIDVESLVLKRGVESNFVDLEKLIPNEMWGMKQLTTFNSDKGFELDFMHFQVEGHELLANELYNLSFPEGEIKDNP